MPADTRPNAPALEDLYAGRAQHLKGEQIWPNSQTDVISLSYGFAAPEKFPTDALLAATAEVLAEDTDGALNYGNSYIGLSELVAARLRGHGAHAIQADNVLLTYGSSQVLGLLSQVFVDPGDVVFVEGPTFMGAVRNFIAGGAELVTIPVDEDGISVDVLEQELREHARRGIRPKFLYTIPTFQNPSGTDLTLERRRRVVQLAAEYGVLVVEDDAYGDLRFEGRALPRLAALDTDGWVLHVGTFSKVLAPGIRMGWAAGPRAVIERLQHFKIEGSSGPYQTRVVERFSADGKLDAHIQELIACYRHKRDIMLDAIKSEFPDDVIAPKPNGGFFIWAKLPDDISATALAKKAVENGVAFVPGTGFYANGQGDDAIRLAFSYQSEERIADGITRIGKAIRALRGS
ncbi:MAG TPA: PLP-dependent aminotransferase family protein [Roseiflexaceae bacterium]|nr:PLP-dependent aminotransferase family protein [Roseiflexaceae bacterium]